MIDNKDLDNNIVKIKKSKFAFLGFIVGITPFILIISLISFHEGGIKYIPNVLKNTIVYAGIITSIINSIVLRKLLSEKFDNI